MDRTLTHLPTATLPTGESVPVLGQGTWRLGERPERRKEELAAMRLGLDLGMTLVDTAEMYGDGATEEFVGEAIAGRRDEVFLVSKALPHNASRRSLGLACERSLRRLRTDRLDLYLLHWRGNVPLEDTVAGFEELQRAGKVLHWGVSNFDVPDLADLARVPGGARVAADQVLWNLAHREAEPGVRPWTLARGVPLMAYSPVDQGRILDEAVLAEVARRHGASPAQVALAWLLAQEQTIVIPKAGRADHVRENREAAELRLTPQDLVELARAFPAPRHPVPLDSV